MELISFERQSLHKRNENLELLLHEVNSMLAPIEESAIGGCLTNKFPIIFIVGCPRSGTTLFMQWLASLGCFGYPTNLLSRFYSAPYIGAKIQLMLTTHDFNNELYDFNTHGGYESRLGKTKGVLAPNEFWYFWRRFFKFPEINYLNVDQLKSVNSKLLVSELAAIENVLNKPIAMKAMIMNWNIPFISENFRKALFIYIKREPFYNIQSLLYARNDYYGDIRAWYSFKPPEYEFLRNKDPYEQVAGQVYYTNSATESGLECVSDCNKLTVNYEQFCSSPESIFGQIKEKFALQGHTPDWEYRGPSSFKSSRSIKLPSEDISKIQTSYFNVTGEQLFI